MRALIKLLLTASLLIFSFVSFAAAQKSSQDQSSENIQGDISQLKHDVKTTASDVEILRRDQVNYKIEKDILKEAYSSNLQSINIVITIVFGIFGVLGYLGLRSIKEIKLDYTNELNDLKSLKAKFETELLRLENNQNEFEKKVVDLAKTNEEQDRRLKVLELTEKAAGYIQSKQWSWALQYISVGLDLAPNNDVLLTQKALCHSKLGDLNSGLDAWTKVLKLQPDNLTIVTNVLELLALTNQKNEFDKVYAIYKDKVDKQDNGTVIVYLNVIRELMESNVTNAIKELGNYAKKFPGVTKKHMGSWIFDEAGHVLLQMAAGKSKDLFSSMIKYLDGQISSEELLTSLAK